jgi:RNA polymerase sigma-70 factor (ECF subfamily)
MVLRSRRQRGLREVRINGEFMGAAAPDRALSDVAALGAALEGLPVDVRAVLALHYAQGRTVSEIAGTLGVSVGAAKSRLFRARDALRKALEQGD